MKICGHLKSGHLIKINVEYHCKKCNTSTVVPFWGTMTDAQMDYAKKLAESLLCRTCDADEKIPDLVECLFH